MQTTNLHTAWARLFVRALADAGVRELVVSPGSRSTPLALAASTERALRCHVHVDERVAGFFALGQARATGRPTALVCTSGSAGAHWIPAAIEASLSGVPLVCITADRPWEAHDCASPQTVDQRDVLGAHARHHAELGTPNPSPSALRAVARIAAQSVHRSRWPVPGAVHINARFRKPLEPVNVPASEPWEPLVEALLSRAPCAVHEPVMGASREAVEQLSRALRKARRAWVVCGPTLSHDPAREGATREAIGRLCQLTGAVLMAESTSGARFGVPSGVTALPSFDSLLRSPLFVERARPDVVIELGLPPTSPTYGAWAAESDVPRYVVAPHGWPDPHGNAAGVVIADPGELARALTASLTNHVVTAETLAWGEHLAVAQMLAAEVIDAAQFEARWSEGSVAWTVSNTLPDDAVLCIGNSLPVRDLDTFTTFARGPLRVLHQRGASGIDGLIAGAAGARSVTSSDRLVVCYLGDLSALHDVGGFNAARIAGGPLVILVVQNNGGRIFDQLPLGRIAGPGTELGERFEQLFTTAQPVSFEHVAASFGLGYERIASSTELSRALHEARTHTRPLVLEAVVDHSLGRTLRDGAHAAVRDALATRWA